MVYGSFHLNKNIMANYNTHYAGFEEVAGVWVEFVADDFEPQKF